MFFVESITTIKMFQGRINDLNMKMRLFNPDKKRLRNLDLFVLDNSLRETTVGQLRGHTIENKWQIFDQVKWKGFLPFFYLTTCGISEQIV